MPVLAIDAGTTGVTALVVGEDGGVLSRGYREFAQLFPRPGWVEHEPDDIWTATVAACRAALAGTEAQPTCIGITDQRETAVVWDRRTLRAPALPGNPRPAGAPRRRGPPAAARAAAGDRLAGPPHLGHLRPAARGRARGAGRRDDRPAPGPLLHRHQVLLAGRRGATGVGRRARGRPGPGHRRLLRDRPAHRRRRARDRPEQRQPHAALRPGEGRLVRGAVRALRRPPRRAS